MSLLLAEMTRAASQFASIIGARLSIPSMRLLYKFEELSPGDGRSALQYYKRSYLLRALPSPHWKPRQPNHSIKMTIEPLSSEQGSTVS